MYPEEEADMVDPAEYDVRPPEKSKQAKFEFYKDQKVVGEKGEKKEEEEEAMVQGK